MTIEVALVFDREGKTIAIHQPPGRSSTEIPDTRSLWEIMWEHRDNLGGVAHVHPWHGEAIPSQEDLTTFSALERALGPLLWPITTFSEGRVFARVSEGLYAEVDISDDLLTHLDIRTLLTLSGGSLLEETE